MKRFATFWIAITVVLGITGCASVDRTLAAEELERSFEIRSQWQSTINEPTNTVLNKTLAASDAYWEGSADPIFQALMRKSGDIDDVLVAQAKLTEAQALLSATQAALLPRLTGLADLGIQRTRGVGSDRLFQAQLDGKWPLDLSGAIAKRRDIEWIRTELSQVDLAATRAQTRRTIGMLYIAWRSAHAQIRATERQIANAAELVTLTQARRSSGLDSALAPAQAQTALELAKVRLPALKQDAQRAYFSLQALIDPLPAAMQTRPAASFQNDLSTLALMQTPTLVIARRPDVRRARLALQLAGVQAKLARAERWPTLSVALQLSDTRQRPAIGGLLSTLGATVFDFGQLKALADAADARQSAELARYRGTVQKALADVEIQANGLLQQAQTSEKNQAALAAAEDAAALARSRYRAGLTSFIDVVQAESAVAESDLARVRSRAEEFTAAIELATALGLGQDVPPR